MIAFVREIMFVWQEIWMIIWPLDKSVIKKITVIFIFLNQNICYG